MTSTRGPAALGSIRGCDFGKREVFAVQAKFGASEVTDQRR